MSEQYVLYGGLPPHEAAETSVAAAVEIEEHSGALRQQVKAFIRQAGLEGATDDEIEEALNMRHQTCSARRRELVLLGEVIDSGWRRKTRSGRKAIVWAVLKEQS